MFHVQQPPGHEIGTLSSPERALSTPSAVDRWTVPGLAQRDPMANCLTPVPHRPSVDDGAAGASAPPMCHFIGPPIYLIDPHFYVIEARFYVIEPSIDPIEVHRCDRERHRGTSGSTRSEPKLATQHNTAASALTPSMFHVKHSRDVHQSERQATRARPRAPHLRWYRGLVPRCVG